MTYPTRFLLAAALGLLVLGRGEAQQAAATPAAVTPTPTPEPILVVAPEDARFDVPATDEGLPGEGPIHRAYWFRKNWLALRKQWAADVQKDQGALVFLGDSITQGWQDVGSSFPGIKTANRGISGDTTRGVLIRLKEDVIALNPKGVVILIGTNDIGDAVAPSVIASNLKLIIDTLKASNPAMPVVLCNIMPSSLTKKRTSDVIKKTNALYFEAIADEPQVTVLDTWALFANSHGDAKDEEMPDLLHPNILGYAKWAGALRPVFETLGLAPAWADDFSAEPGFTSLFDGHDLTGWEYDQSQIFTRKTATPDGRYVVKNGRLVVTVAHTSRDYKRLWTTLKYSKDFVLKLEFRASPNADSGIFIREPQLQCRDFIIAGPFATLRNYRPLDWNEIVVTVRGGFAHCVCNGEVLVDSIPVPPNGPIGLESDHGQVEYRRIRMQEAR
jgi:lysophospholipase L1-like esterase